MKQWRKRFKEISLLKRTILIYVCVTIVPTFFMVLYLSISQFDRLYSDAVNSKQLALKQMSVSMDTALLSAEDLSQSLAYKSPISTLISRDDLNSFPIWTQRSTEESVEALKYSLKYQNLGIEAISIFTNKSELTDTRYFYQESLLYSFDFYKNFRTQKRQMAFYHLGKKETEKFYSKKGGTPRSEETLLFVQRIQDEEENLYSGLLILEINPRKFLSSLNEKEGSEYTIYFTNTQSFWGGKVKQSIINSIQSSPNKEKVNHSNSAAEILYTQLPDYDLLIIDKENVQKKEYLFLALRIFFIFIFQVVIQVLGLRYLIRYIQGKINKNLNEMDAIIASGFEGTIEENKQDEFQFVTVRFNKLLKKIHQLITDIIAKERESKEAQIQALQYQMDPHFIYNTLSIFASIAYEKKEYELADAISYFGHLLRYNIKKTGVFSTVKEELDNAYSLIKVYSIRYEEHLELLQEIPQELYQVKIIKYLLQPIMENAILHGRNANQTQMTIQVSALHSDMNLIITVVDNGCGIDSTRLEQLRKNIIEEKVTDDRGNDRVGLTNVYRRLQLIYGEQAQLIVNSKLSQGTTVTIVIPWKAIERSEEG